MYNHDLYLSHIKYHNNQGGVSIISNVCSSLGTMGTMRKWFKKYSSHVGRYIAFFFEFFSLALTLSMYGMY